MAAITLEHITKRFPGGIVACDGLDLQVREGELLALLGPSGSGKSTLLRLVAGLEHPTAGNIRFGDQVVNDVPARNRDVAMVFQSHALYPHWTVYKNLAFGLRLRRSAAAAEEIERRVSETAAELGLEPLLNRMPGELSGGEAQRVALGRAMVRQPSVFLFDEPLSNLDAPLRLELRRQIKRLHAQLGTTMLYVTHDQAEALALGDRLAVIHRGRIEQIGEPPEVYDRPANRFVAGFVGSPPMNFFDARPAADSADGPFTLSAGDWSIAADRRWWPAAETGPGYVVGFRPEHIRISISSSNQPPTSIHPADGPTLSATIELIEPEGDSCLVTISPRITGDAEGANAKNPASPKWPGAVLCRSRDCWGLKPGEQVIALFDMRRAHWFDRSGRKLVLAGGRVR